MIERETLISMVQGVQQGDENAVVQMYTTFQQDLYYFIYKTVNDKELAEDLTQDTFLDILQNIHKLQEPAAFINWSRQVAYHRCTAYFRKRHDLLLDEDEDGYSVMDTVEEERAEFIPDEALDQEEFKKTIHAMIDALPPEQRSAILMRYFDELSVEEIAKIQGVSTGTVKSRLNYGRKAIKSAVDTYEKKSGVKLRSIGVLPVLLWLFREAKLAGGVSITGKAVTSTVFSTGNAIATASTVANTVSGAAEIAKETAKKGAKKGLGAIFKTTASKMVAGMTATAVLAGGAVEIAHIQKDNKKEISESKSAYTMEWLGYGSCDSYSDYRYEITLTEFDEEQIAGSIAISYLYQGVYVSDFSGSVTKKDAEKADDQADEETAQEEENPEREYLIEFDKIYHHNTFGSFTTESMNIIYHTEDQTISLFYPFEVTLHRQQANKTPICFAQDAVYSGMGNDPFHQSKKNHGHQFSCTIQSITEDSISGSFATYFEGEKLYETGFTGRGYATAAGYRYEVLLDNPRNNGENYSYNYKESKYLWLYYDIEFDRLSFANGHIADGYVAYDATMERTDKTES